MPVEIKELVIRAIAAPEPEDDQEPMLAPAPPTDQDALIQECVRQVLRILKKQAER